MAVPAIIAFVVIFGCVSYNCSQNKSKLLSENISLRQELEEKDKLLQEELVNMPGEEPKLASSTEGTVGLKPGQQSRTTGADTNQLVTAETQQLEATLPVEGYSAHGTDMIYAPSVDNTAPTAPDGNNLTQEQIDAYRCMNQMRQITLAAGQWAEIHGGLAPTNFLCLRDAVAPMLLICPSVRPKSVTMEWNQFDITMITSEMKAPGIQWDGVHRPYIVCPKHQAVAYAHWPYSGQIRYPLKWMPKFQP